MGISAMWNANSLTQVFNAPSLPSLPGSLQPGVVVRDRVLSMSQIELFDF